MSHPSPPWIETMSACLSELEREQAGSPCPIVDHEVAGNLGGRPDDLCVWFICRTRDEKTLFTDTELSRNASMLRRKLLERGFPEPAIDALTIKVASREEIDEAGGRFSFFR